MFRTNSPYSSFFMSGFSYNEEEEFEPDFRRRGSLPTDCLSTSSKTPLRRQRKTDQERSFLSLDLAESVSAYAFPVPPSSGPALRSQVSLASMRSVNRIVPSPKPIPSSSLPSLPTPSSSRRLSSIPSVSDVATLPKEPSSPAPSSTLIPSTSSLKILAPKPLSISATVPKLGNRSNSTRTSSTVSTHYRRTKRSDALARLEGRGAKRNFMSMSDDEEADESFLDIAQDSSPRRSSISSKFTSGFFGFGNDHVLPSSPNHKHSHSSPFPTPSTFDFAIEKPPIVDVPTSAVSPTESRLSFFSSFSPPKGGRRRSRTLIFPLTSFIDLTTKGADHEEKRDNGRWRSFIEIAGL
ncbi:hypothetical protein Moror_14139 [Moniliophthora roreri MCA 2997]|uniref:Uncharacterized protein n=2 Tax=Moniliophthora roreri TaxID=221103 RepID=V2XPS8_MONRO|nr:hypothetical protein Moror_14139 [Moniliophthora roreri MCA 2997]KAI3619850.1 hypothetical protein WG66_002738 [Moniliophthora roreri]